MASGGGISESLLNNIIYLKSPKYSSTHCQWEK
jgi:hypothetical protein